MESILAGAPDGMCLLAKLQADAKSEGTFPPTQKTIFNTYMYRLLLPHLHNLNIPCPRPENLTESNVNNLDVIITLFMEAFAEIHQGKNMMVEFDNDILPLLDAFELSAAMGREEYIKYLEILIKGDLDKLTLNSLEGKNTLFGELTNSKLPPVTIEVLNNNNKKGGAQEQRGGVYEEYNPIPEEKINQIFIGTSGADGDGWEETPRVEKIRIIVNELGEDVLLRALAASRKGAAAPSSRVALLSARGAPASSNMVPVNRGNRLPLGAIDTRGGPFALMTGPAPSSRQLISAAAAHGIAAQGVARRDVIAQKVAEQIILTNALDTLQDTLSEGGGKGDANRELFRKLLRTYLDKLFRGAIRRGQTGVGHLGIAEVSLQKYIDEVEKRVGKVTTGGGIEGRIIRLGDVMGGELFETVTGKKEAALFVLGLVSAFFTHNRYCAFTGRAPTIFRPIPVEYTFKMPPLQREESLRVLKKGVMPAYKYDKDKMKLKPDAQRMVDAHLGGKASGKAIANGSKNVAGLRKLSSLGKGVAKATPTPTPASGWLSFFPNMGAAAFPQLDGTPTGTVAAPSYPRVAPSGQVATVSTTQAPQDLVFIWEPGVYGPPSEVLGVNADAILLLEPDATILNYKADWEIMPEGCPLNTQFNNVNRRCESYDVALLEEGMAYDPTTGTIINLAHRERQGQCLTLGRYAPGYGTGFSSTLAGIGMYAALATNPITLPFAATGAALGALGPPAIVTGQGLYECSDVLVERGMDVTASGFQMLLMILFAFSSLTSITIAASRQIERSALRTTAARKVNRWQRDVVAPLKRLTEEVLLGQLRVSLGALLMNMRRSHGDEVLIPFFMANNLIRTSEFNKLQAAKDALDRNTKLNDEKRIEKKAALDKEFNEESLLPAFIDYWALNTTAILNERFRFSTEVADPIAILTIEVIEKIRTDPQMIQALRDTLTGVRPEVMETNFRSFNLSSQQVLGVLKNIGSGATSFFSPNRGSATVTQQGRSNAAGGGPAVGFFDLGGLGGAIQDRSAAAFSAGRPVQPQLQNQGSRQNASVAPPPAARRVPVTLVNENRNRAYPAAPPARALANAPSALGNRARNAAAAVPSSPRDAATALVTSAAQAARAANLGSSGEGGGRRKTLKRKHIKKRKGTRKH